MLFKNFKCVQCGSISTAGEWNNSTKKQANKQKLNMRTFKGIQFSLHTQRTYFSPCCNAWVPMAKIQPLMLTEVKQC